jgi:hypothetical protein
MRIDFCMREKCLALKFLMNFHENIFVFELADVKTISYSHHRNIIVNLCQQNIKYKFRGKWGPSKAGLAR